MNDIQMRRQTYIGIFLSPCFSFVFHMPGGFFLIMLTIDVKNVSYQFQNRVMYWRETMMYREAQSRLSVDFKVKFEKKKIAWGYE